ILSFILASSAAFADTAFQVTDKQKAANDQPPAMSAPDNSHRNSNPAQGSIVDSNGQIAAAPSEFMSAPQYQPQPLQQNQPSPLYSLSPP
ncbi:MAG: hypothetical protein ACM3W8_04875, partial [Sideroxydans sp.]